VSINLSLSKNWQGRRKVLHSFYDYLIATVIFIIIIDLSNNMDDRFSRFSSKLVLMNVMRSYLSLALRV
jgi:hypothetical protein